MKKIKIICITFSILIFVVSLIILSVGYNTIGIILLLFGFCFLNYSLVNFKLKVSNLVSTVILGIIVYVIWDLY